MKQGETGRAKSGGNMPASGIWAAAVVVGTGATIAAAAAGSQQTLIAVCAVVAVGFALIAVVERQRLTAQGAGETALAAASGSAMAVVWAWAAVSLLVIYVQVLSWHEWWQYVLGAGVLAAMCWLFAMMLGRDAAAGRRDEAMLKLARYLTIAQLAGMVVAMVGLIIDDKMPRTMAEPDWAANTIFFFGAAALAAISANGLRPSPAPQT